MPSSLFGYKFVEKKKRSTQYLRMNAREKKKKNLFLYTPYVQTSSVQQEKTNDKCGKNLPNSMSWVEPQGLLMSLGSWYISTMTHKQTIFAHFWAF